MLDKVRPKEKVKGKGKMGVRLLQVNCLSNEYVNFKALHVVLSQHSSSYLYTDGHSLQVSCVLMTLTSVSNIQLVVVMVRRVRTRMDHTFVTVVAVMMVVSVISTLMTAFQVSLLI